MKNKNLSIFIFKIIPKSLLSRIFGYIALIPIPVFLMGKLIKWYSGKFGVKNEYIIPEKGFKNFNDFFTRKLKPGIHKIDTSTLSIVSPVDARIDQYGAIDGSYIIQAKGINYSVYDLVPSETSNFFTGGSFMTLYLSPGDYHRIHSPVDGKIIGYFNIPGKLFTVQEYMVNGLNGLFNLNERLISYIKTNRGLVGVCKVGAMNVGKISLSYDSIITNKAIRSKNEFFYPETDQKEIKKGDELGIFNLGSTIILLFEKNMIKFDNFTPGTNIRLGEKIGIFSKN